MKILITGDTFLGTEHIQKLAEQGQAEVLFGHYLALIRASDLAITNLESPVLDGGTKMPKSGPHLKASTKSLKVLKTAGFDLLTLANNHIRDYGDQGVCSTLDSCTEIGLSYTGAGRDLSEAQHVYYLEKDGVKVAVVNIAENEFGTTHGDYPGGNPLELMDNFSAIQVAKKNADKVFVILHGGHEHYAYPSPRVKKTCRFFVDAGADAVIGHHSHWFSGIEVYKGAPIIYSLGNFLFSFNDQRNSEWNRGYGVQFTLQDGALSFEVLPFKQNDDVVGIQPLSEGEQREFETRLAEINQVIADDKLLEARFDEFCKQKETLYGYFLEPHASRNLHRLKRLGLFPSLWSSSKKIMLQNLIRCEAHRDIVLKFL